MSSTWPSARCCWGGALFAGLDLPALGYACTEVVPGERATYVMPGRRP